MNLHVCVKMCRPRSHRLFLLRESLVLVIGLVLVHNLRSAQFARSALLLTSFVLASNLTLVSSLSLASTFPLGLASLLSRTAPSRQEDSLSSLREPWRPSLRLQLILCKLVCLKKHETPGCDWNSFFIFVLPKRGLCFFFR